MRIGFIGFGEAGSTIAGGLRGAGVDEVVAFDINAAAPGRGERIQQRAAESGTRLVDSSEALARSADLLMSVVTADSAVAAARQTGPFLTPAHLYVDLNSVAPFTKRTVARELAEAGSRFVEGAIMAPVAGQGHRVPILLNGEWAADVMAALAPWEMRLERMNRDIGAAAAVKMCRSLIVKGLEALLLECSLAAREYDATDRVFESLGKSYPGMQWPEMATYMMGRVLEHGERRAAEMREVADTLRAAGVEPLMAEAIARRQDWKAGFVREGRPTSAVPDSVESLLDALVSPEPHPAAR